MTFIKENLPEVTTTDKITDLVVFEKGNNRPKRIKKTNFAGGLPYKSYIALLNQSGSNAPVATVLTNELGSEVTFIRNNTGDYNGSCLGLIEGRTTVEIGQTYYTGVGSYVNHVYLTTHPTFAIATAQNNVLVEGGYLENTLLEIRVFPV